MAKILFHTDAWAGTVYNAGAERYAETIANYLVSKGHEVHVLTIPAMARDGEERNGIVFNTKILDEVSIKEEYQWADFVTTQIAYTPRVRDYCVRYGKRFIYLIHNNVSVPYWNVRPEEVFLAVYNADWVRTYHNKDMKWSCKNELTFYPPIIFDKFQCSNSEKKYITLVNLSRNKGVHTLIQAAKMMPEYEFLGVLGSYDEQVLKLPSNVTVIPNTNNMVEDVYSKSKVVIMPSLKETWGMVAIEAMCSGIPVVAAPTEGLLEACAPAGIFIIRDKAFLWESTLRRLMTDEKYYNHYSELSIERAKYLDSVAKKQLEELELFIRENSM